MAKHRRRVPNPTYRRSRHVVCYWKHGNFVFHNYARGEIAGASALACEILDFCEEWRSAGEIRRLHPSASAGAMKGLIDQLTAKGLLERSDRRRSAEDRAMDTLDRWNPEAGFFHSATRNVRFIDARIAQAELREQARTWPMPPPTKPRSRGAIALERPRATSELERVLLQRRSWRRFGKGSIPLATLGSMLGLTAGIQYWIDVPGQGRIALKTAPSGGARHPVELYVLAWRIRGLRAGLYHYAADTHALEPIKSGLGSARIREYLPEGDYFRHACALIIFTAVYERDLWRYRYSRAYRAPLVEAGHLCQTFCLLATSHNLAPFCAMGLGDSNLEHDLGIDGVRESALYVAGVGIRPPATTWAPAPEGFRRPVITPNDFVLDPDARLIAEPAKVRTRKRA
jgi:SagB-type dehydrogenase family enzyme